MKNKKDSYMEDVGIIRKIDDIPELKAVAFKIHRLAREEKDPIRVKVLIVMGQVAATPHVKRHALIASDYANCKIPILLVS